MSEEQKQIKKFIKLVRERRFIYDLSDNGFKHRYKRADAWIEIANEMGTQHSSTYWCNKWKTLRDNYNKFKKAQTEGASQTYYKKYRNWPWAKFMKFLDDVPYMKPSPSNTIVPSQDTADKLEPDSNSIVSCQDTTDKSEPAVSNLQDTAGDAPDLSDVEFVEVIVDPVESQDLGNSRVSVSQGLKGKAKKNSKTNPMNEHVAQKNRVRYDETDLFFLSYAQNFKRFSKRSQALIKLEISSLFTRYELLETSTHQSGEVLSPDIVSSHHQDDEQVSNNSDDIYFT